jgi:hypothetical protein
MTHSMRPLALLALAVALAGCGSRDPRPQPLTPAAFSSPGATDAGNPGTTPGGTGPEDAGQPAHPAVRIPLNGKKEQPPAQPAANTTPQSANNNGQRTTDNRPLATGNEQRTTDNGQRTTRPTVGTSSGQFLTLGGVVAEVNGTPIYANKVLAPLDHILRTKARQMDLGRFRQSAQGDIRNQIIEKIFIELEYATAQRALDAQDKKLADMATMGHRMRLITNAGGSLEVARRKAYQETGLTFEELIAEQSRIELSKLFYQKKIYPLVQVTGNDVRAYYEKNVDQYTENEKVKFRVLKVDPRKAAVTDAAARKDAAANRVADLYNRAKAGEDFERMVLKENDDPMFARTDLGEVSPSSFAIAKIREALPKLRPGDITTPIADANAYYIVQLVDRKPGRVRPFEDQTVQDEIRIKLRGEQLGALREKHRRQLIANAILRPSLPVLMGQQPPADPQEAQMINTALEMALQRYPEYASAK